MQILLAIDDSKFTAAAVQTVLIQARSYSTEIQVLQVVEPPLHSGAREMEGYDSAIHAAWEAESRQAEAWVAPTAKGLRSQGLKAAKAVEQCDAVVYNGRGVSRENSSCDR